MNMKTLLVLLTVFIVGAISALALDMVINRSYKQSPATTTYIISDSEEDEGSTFITRILSTGNEEKPSPFDRITEDKIHVYGDRIVIDIDDAQWARFTDTNSMDPVIDIGSNAIEIIPQEPDEIRVGDIVSYESDYAEGTIIHRVVETGHDNKGWYAIMKGDNNPRNDPGKVRFSQIRRLVIAVIY